ncbi:polyphosphate kinase 2 [Hyphobacterium sp. CCMP332]|nr:polyphosphate kinase 2 [Hyphobacterium sp. CCMP332]
MARLNKSDFQSLNSRGELIQIAEQKGINLDKIYENEAYEKSLLSLQVELVNLQHWIEKTNARVAILFEGRDTAGKGGAIKRFTQHLNPRSMRVVALNKPTEIERGQWYFRRYIKEMPNPGEIVFFDRSWYNRAVVEPIMEFCKKEEYQRFMDHVNEFEHMLYEDGVVLIKFWLDISKSEQMKRIKSRQKNPLKQWKVSPVDLKAHKLWNKFTFYKEQMFSRTHSSFSPWIIINSDEKKVARLECIRYVLSKFDYELKSKDDSNLLIDPNVLYRYYRRIEKR